MPSLNQAQFVRQAVESVFSQRQDALELIVADGGSSDGTLDVLEELSRSHPRLVWSSQADTGPAQAINRALSQAEGEFIGWLNSDDLYASQMMEKALSLFEDHPELVMVYGHGQHIDGEGDLIGDYPTLPPPIEPQRFHAGCPICQPTVVFKSTLLEEVGFLDEELKASFDFDYWLRVFGAYPGRIGFVDGVQAYSRLHDDCITRNARRRVATEGLIVTKRHLGSSSVHWLTTYLEEYADDATDNVLVADLLAELDAVLAAAPGCVSSEDAALARAQLELMGPMLAPSRGQDQSNRAGQVR
ncbi:glycosyltransferase family 2 protein [Parvularcula maris]